MTEFDMRNGKHRLTIDYRRDKSLHAGDWLIVSVGRSYRYDGLGLKSY